MSLHKPTLFSGAATALITPFRQGEIHREALAELIEQQIAGGIQAILVAGTTGENATISFAEHGQLVSFAKERIRGRVPLLAGCGSNCTSRACELARISCDAGADGLLAVTPYYNKTSDRGILLHYETIAKAARRPVIVYNVPARTGFRLTMTHYRALVAMDNIVGVKEASGDLALLEELCAECGEELDVYTGNDDQTVGAMRLGARGVISVCSNVYPRAMTRLCALCSEENWREAARLLGELRPLMAALFREVNPIPVKYLASLRGLCLPEYRLPLCPPSPAVERLLEEMKERYREWE